MKKDYTGLDIAVLYFTDEDIVTLSAIESNSQQSTNKENGSYGNDLIGKDIFKD